MKNIRYIKLLLTLAPLTSTILPIVACNKSGTQKKDNQELKTQQAKLYSRSLLAAREHEIKPDDILKELFQREEQFSDSKEIKFDSLFDNDTLKNKFFNRKSPSEMNALPKEKDDPDFVKIKGIIDNVISSIIQNKDDLSKVLDEKKELLGKLWNDVKDENISEDFKNYLQEIVENLEKLFMDMTSNKTYKDIINDNSENIRDLFLEIFGKNINNKQNNWDDYNKIFDDKDWTKDIEKKWNENDSNKIKWSMKLARLLVPFSVLIIEAKQEEKDFKEQYLKKTYEGFKNLDITKFRDTILDILDANYILSPKGLIMSIHSILQIDNDNNNLKKLIEPITINISEYKEKIVKELPFLAFLNFEKLPLKQILENIPTVISALSDADNPEIAKDVRTLITEKLSWLTSMLNTIFDFPKDTKSSDVDLNSFFKKINDLLKQIINEWDTIWKKLKSANGEDDFIEKIYDILGARKNGEVSRDNSIFEKLQNIAKDDSLILKLINNIVQSIPKKIKYDYWEKEFKKSLINFSEEKITNKQSGEKFDLEFKVRYVETQNCKFTWSIDNDNFKITNFEWL